MRRALIIAFFLCVGLPGAETPEPPSPETIAAGYFEGWRDQDWEKAAAYMAPEALAEFRELIGPLLDRDSAKAQALREALFGEGSTRGSVQGLSDAQFLAGALGNRVARISEGMLLHYRKTEVLGSVPEGDDLVHVVVRLHIDVVHESSGRKLSQAVLELVSLRRGTDGWGVLLNEGERLKAKRAIEKALEED